MILHTKEYSRISFAIIFACPCFSLAWTIYRQLWCTSIEFIILLFWTDTRTPPTMKLLLSSVLGLVSFCPAIFACSRVTWTGPVAEKSVVITGRSTNWPYGFNSHFYVYPHGEKADGAAGDNSLSFETLYGMVLLSGSTDIGGPIDGVFDGMNKEGIVANLLYLAENNLGNVTDSDHPHISFAAWTLYLLSQFSNVMRWWRIFRSMASRSFRFLLVLEVWHMQPYTWWFLMPVEIQQ